MTTVPEEWCQQCGGGMVRNGLRAVGFADLRAPLSREGIRTQALVQRMLCRRCRHVVHRGGPELVRGTRVTPRLADVVVDDMLSGLGYADTARRHGLEPRTIHTLWNLAVGNARGRIIDHPDLARLLPLSVGAGSAACLRDDTGKPLGVFTGPVDTHLLDWISSHPGGLLLVHPRLWLSPQSNYRLHIGCDRSSVLATFEEGMQAVLQRARVWMDRVERRVLREVWPIICKQRAARSPEEDDILEEATSVHHRLGELRTGVDGFRAAIGAISHERGHGLMERWKAKLSAFGRDVFTATLTMLGRVEKRLFGEGWNWDITHRNSDMVSSSERTRSENFTSIGQANLMLSRTPSITSRAWWPYPDPEPAMGFS